MDDMVFPQELTCSQHLDGKSPDQIQAKSIIIITDDQFI